MNLSIEFRAELPLNVRAAFRRDCETIWSVFDAMRKQDGIPSTSAHVILTDRFSSDVHVLLRQLNPDASEFSWTPERLGGTVVGKNLPLVGDYSEVAIVFDSVFWRDYDDSDVRRLAAFLMIAHELAHPLIDRARVHAGIADDNKTTGLAWTHRILRSLSNEFVADRISDILARTAFSVSVAGNERRIGSWELTGEPFYLPQLRDVVAAVHPRWAETVTEYRIGGVTLDRLWDVIRRESEELLTLLVHTQAARDGFGEETINILDDEGIRSLPATDLYLREPWHELLPLLDACGNLTSPAAIQQSDSALTSQGVRILWSIWARLGLTREDLADDHWALWVSDPLCCSGTACEMQIPLRK